MHANVSATAVLELGIEVLVPDVNCDRSKHALAGHQTWSCCYIPFCMWCVVLCNIAVLPNQALVDAGPLPSRMLTHQPWSAQVCVTTSTGYFQAEQLHPYGDIRITEGPKAL